jgi:hypothetical protein
MYVYVRVCAYVCMYISLCVCLPFCVSLCVCVCTGKKPYELNKKFEGDYISSDAALAPAFAAARGSFLGGTRDTEIVFAAIVTKVSRKGRGDPRAIVVSENYLYRLDPKNFKPHKPAVALATMQGISVTPKKDTVVAVHLAGGFDTLVDVGIGPGGDKVRARQASSVSACQRVCVYVYVRILPLYICVCAYVCMCVSSCLLTVGPRPRSAVRVCHGAAAVT